MKKICLILLISVISLFNLSAASKKNSKAKEKIIKIGITQISEHSALDMTYRGFIDGLAEEGYIDGKNIKIDYQIAQGDQANCVTIAQKFINDKDDLIFAISTPSAQAVANLTEDIPIVISAVTDPVTAKLVKSNEKPGTNVTGTSDLTPLEAQMKLLKKLFPEAKTVGVLYCSNEQNSIFQVELLRKICANLQLKPIEATVTNSNEIYQVTQSVCKKCDVLYVPSDNMLADAMPLVTETAIENKKATIVSGTNVVKAGGLATYGLNYYELGKQSAKMAIDIFKNGKNPKDMPIQYLEKCDFTYNEETARKLGITIPEDLK